MQGDRRLFRKSRTLHARFRDRTHRQAWGCRWSDLSRRPGLVRAVLARRERERACNGTISPSRSYYISPSCCVLEKTIKSWLHRRLFGDIRRWGGCRRTVQLISWCNQMHVAKGAMGGTLLRVAPIDRPSWKRWRGEELILYDWVDDGVDGAASSILSHLSLSLSLSLSSSLSLLLWLCVCVCFYVFPRHIATLCDTSRHFATYRDTSRHFINRGSCT